MSVGTVHHLQSVVGLRSDPRHPDRECTLTEVAEKLGMTRQYAWTLENSALRKCRKFCVDHGIRLEDLVG